MSQVSYSTNDNGKLSIFYGNEILTEISQCKHYTDEQLENIVDEVLSGMGYVWQPDGTLTEKEENDVTTQHEPSRASAHKNKHKTKKHKHRK